LHLFLTCPSPTEPSTLPLHDALPISALARDCRSISSCNAVNGQTSTTGYSFSNASIAAWSSSTRGRSEGVSPAPDRTSGSWAHRSEEHTSELQSRENLVCRLPLENKK